MKRLWQTLNNIMNDFSIKKKLLLIYVFCMLIPLLLTDSVIIYIVVMGEKNQQQYQAENIASAVAADLNNTIGEAIKIANSIYINRQISEILEYEYEDGLEYFERNYNFMGRHFLNVVADGERLKLALYSDNDSIINGGIFFRIGNIRGTQPYEMLENVSDGLAFGFYYQENPTNLVTRRKIALVKRLDYYKDLKAEKILVIELDYSYIVRRFNEMKYGAPVYFCIGDKILFSNDGYSEPKLDFQKLSGKEKIRLERPFSMAGEEFRILVMEPKDGVTLEIRQHLPLLFMLIFVNILLPCVMTLMINRSFVVRLQELSQALETVDGEEFTEIVHTEGKDEIGVLIRNYNRMIKRIQDLIRTAFKEKLEKQEVDLARQRAELLALHSQINPHFLFNVLESIRMHSILKKEDETASMVERLAVLERQNVDWSSDNIPIKEELRFIEAYLELQKYRFGKRLSYEISVGEGCGDYLIPRLTLVTFVENACVHGVEKKAAPCWIYVRIYAREDVLFLEIEDTGSGMDEETVQSLLCQMEHADIEALQKKEHIGVINACLRLKRSMQGQVTFELESEKDVGTFMIIKVPEKELQKSLM